jgi:hypothetical protein
MAIVYQHLRKDTNQIFYIGIGKTIKRAYQTRGRNKLWNNIIKKTNYNIEIIYDNLSWEDACIKEKELISKYGRIDLKTGILTNMTDGGDGLSNMSEEFKTNMSKIKLGKPGPNKGIKMSEETKEKLRQHNLGKKHSDESKKKISESNMGKCHLTEESKKSIGLKNSIKLKGKKLSEETKMKMSKSRIGRIVSEETRKKISETNILTKSKKKFII